MINVLLKTVFRLFALQDDIGTDILQLYNEKQRLIDLPQSSQFLATADASINATVLHKGVSHWLNFAPWPAWNVSFCNVLYSAFYRTSLQYDVYISAE